MGVFPGCCWRQLYSTAAAGVAQHTAAAAGPEAIRHYKVRVVPLGIMEAVLQAWVHVSGSQLLQHQ